MTMRNDHQILKPLILALCTILLPGLSVAEKLAELPDLVNPSEFQIADDGIYITDEAGDPNYAFYWTGTTFLKSGGSAARAVYVAFGEGLGSMDGTTVIDVHGAGCQRSSAKDGDPDDYPTWGFGPQGDVDRLLNYARLVRDAD